MDSASAEHVSASIAASLARDQDDPLLRCGRAIKFDLEEGFQARKYGAFESLLSLAEEKINTLPFEEVDACWLRLYVDASIGLALNHLDKEPTARRKGARIMIGKLDMAVIVAGGIGPGRMDCIQRLIKLCQVDVSSRRQALDSSSGPSSAKRSRVSSSKIQKSGPPLHFAPRPVPELASPPSLESYVAAHSKQPFILRNYLSEELGWPAVTRWVKSGYLLDLVGPGRVVPVEVGKSYTDAGWGQQIVPLEEFMQRIGYGGPNSENAQHSDEKPAQSQPSARSLNKLPDEAPLYLAQHPLFAQFPQLERDISMPDYVYSCPPAPANLPSYVPPGNEDGLIVNVWVGGGGGQVTSPAHTDPYYNCYAQVLGQKRVWIAPPNVTLHMYAFDDEQGDGVPGKMHQGSTLPAEAVEADAETGSTTSYASNTSKVPIFQAPDEESLRRFPAFYDKALSGSMEAVLEAGDMLVMPPGWWHAMRGEGDGVAWSVSMWY